MGYPPLKSSGTSGTGQFCKAIWRVGRGSRWKVVFRHRSSEVAKARSGCRFAFLKCDSAEPYATGIHAEVRGYDGRHTTG